MNNPEDYEYCGCCGRRLRHKDMLWCLPCLRHVSTEGHLWDRTHEARTGQPCPFAVVRAPMSRADRRALSRGRR